MFRQHAQRRPRGGSSEQIDVDEKLSDGGPYGACSTFYTNNPLLYVSHYSPMSGVDENPTDDVIGGTDLSMTVMSQMSQYSIPVSDLVPDPLVNRRQAVEMLCLDRPLLDYLVQNGVLDKSQQDAINENANDASLQHPMMTSARRNLMVLRCVDSAGRRGLELLINALRFTGQFILANMIDVGCRIELQEYDSDAPANFFGKYRRKGQVRINLRVSSVRLFNSIDSGSDRGHSAGEPCHSAADGDAESSPNWISLEELDRRLQIMTSRKTDAVKRGQVTRHRRPVQLVPSSTVGASSTTSAASRSRPEMIDLVDRKQQFIGRLVTWMTTGLQRGRYSRNISEADVPKSTSKSGVISQQQRLTSNRRSHSDDDMLRDMTQRSAISARGKSNVHSSTTGYFRSHRQDTSRTSVPPHSPSASGLSDDVSRTARQRQSIDKLRRAADCVRVASQEFYSALTGNTMFGDVSRSRDRLLRYFEVKRKVLVLDTSVVDIPDSSRLQWLTTTSSVSCLSVTVICPTAKHFDSLRRDCGVGQLRDDLEQRLLTTDLIDELNAEIDAIHLDVQLDIDDMERAQSDFQWCR